MFIRQAAARVARAAVRQPATQIRASSRIAGFHKMDHQARLDAIQERTSLTDAQVAEYKSFKSIDFDLADHLVENVVGIMSIPVGVATNVIVDGTERLVAMATEESSVVAAVCNTAKQCRDTGGFKCSTSGPLMIAQIQLVNITDPEAARMKILERRAEIEEVCNATDPIMTGLGGGFRDLEVRVLESKGGPMVVAHLVVDTRDAMGANAVNSMAETLGPQMAEWTEGKCYLRILSNLADRRLARARAVWKADTIGGKDVVDGIIAAYQFAECDPYRAATHNKGIMNGISAVVLATGNDTRAVESGAHAYACRNGRYSSLTTFEVTADGDLAGSIELPLAVGTVGGATKAHPMARNNLELMGVTSADELQRIIAATGLAQNFGALKALATVGIQKGHMSLHSSNVAMMAGAVGPEIDAVAEKLVELGTVRQDVAEKLLAELRAN